jgi:thioredoxin-related protein
VRGAIDMKRGRLLCGLISGLFALSLTAYAQAGEGGGAQVFDDSRISRIDHPAWFKASFLDLREDLADARRAGKRGVMLFFDLEGCAYCKAFIRHTLGDPAIQARLRDAFDVIGMSMFSDLEVVDFTGRNLRLKRFARREGATVSPTLVFYGSDGRRLLRVVGYYPPERFRVVLDYLDEDRAGTQSLRDYMASRERTPGATAREREPDNLFLDEPYALERSRIAAERPLLALFEGAGCDECDRFRDHVLAHPPIRRALKGFDLVRIDWSDDQTRLITPAGEASTPLAWADALKIRRVPALIFFDRAGREVFRLESLVMRLRMERALEYVRDKAYRQGQTFQQYTRNRTLELLESQRRHGG